jgi:hypothetical protein
MYSKEGTKMENKNSIIKKYLLLSLGLLSHLMHTLSKELQFKPLSCQMSLDKLFCMNNANGRIKS